MAPTYQFGAVVLSSDKVIGVRTSITITPTTGDVGKSCLAVIPNADLVSPSRRGQLTKYRMVGGVWTKVNFAGFQGAPTNMDGTKPIYTGVELDADDVGKDIQFTWESESSFTAKLQLATIIDSEE